MTWNVSAGISFNFVFVCYVLVNYWTSVFYSDPLYLKKRSSTIVHTIRTLAAQAISQPWRWFLPTHLLSQRQLRHCLCLPAGFISWAAIQDASTRAMEATHSDCHSCQAIAVLSLLMLALCPLTPIFIIEFVMLVLFFISIFVAYCWSCCFLALRTTKS